MSGGQFSRCSSCDERVLIELSVCQVQVVVSAVADADRLTAVLWGRVGVDGFLGRGVRELSDRRLSRSLLIGLLVLGAFPRDGSSIGVAELARLVGKSAASTQRYVATLAAVGVVERDSGARRYRIAADGLAG
jgi:IclR helix-turn-helix domain